MKCSKCKGEGIIKTYGHVVGGLCFKCYGVGTNDTEAIKEAKAMYQNKEADKVTVTAEEEKAGNLYQLAHYYKKLNDPKISDKRKVDYRKWANDTWKQCKANGYKFTLEEIKDMAVRLDHSLPF